MSHSNDPLDQFFKKNMPKAPAPPANEKVKIFQSILEESSRVKTKKSFFHYLLNPALMGILSVMVVTGVIVVKTKVGKDVTQGQVLSDREKNELAGFFGESLSALDENSEFSLDDSNDSSDNSL